MVSTSYGGRLGNNMFQYVAAYLFAKKHNLFMVSPPKHGSHLNGVPFFNDFGLHFNIDTHTGTNIYQGEKYPVFLIYDRDYMPLMRHETVTPAHYVFEDWFQIPEFVLNYRQEIKNVFNPIYRERDENDLFVSVRLGDISHTKAKLSIEFYKRALDAISFKTGYISSDSMEDTIIQQLIADYKLIPYNNSNPLEKMDFAKDFNKLILSEGTFCWWIGALSKARTIICNNRHIRPDGYTWHGNIFVYPEWAKLSMD